MSAHTLAVTLILAVDFLGAVVILRCRVRAGRMREAEREQAQREDDKREPEDMPLAA
jgi:hypothetical protein